MKSFLLCCCFFSTWHVFSQNDSYYNVGIGLRAGETSGATVKIFCTETVAIEAIIGYWNRQVAGTVLLEKHFEPFRVRGLCPYFGGGFHVAGATGYNRWYHLGRKSYEYRNEGTGFGLDAIAGIEFKFPVLPVAINFDIKPFMEVSSEGGVWIALDPGVGIKLAL